MIQQLEIRGYRSLREVNWSPGKLNVVIGPNGSGKSNLLRALIMLQRAGAGDLKNVVLEEGGFGAIVWDGQADQIRFRLKTDPIDPKRDRQKDALTYELRMQRVGFSSFRIEHEVLGNFYRKDTGQASEPFKLLERRPGHAVLFDAQHKELVAPSEAVVDEQTLLSSAAGPFANQIVVAFWNLLSSWGVFHDIHVEHRSAVRQAAVARIEQRVAADGQNLIPVLHTLYSSSRDFKREVDRAMRAAFGDDFEELSFPPAADQRVQLRVRWRSLQTAQSADDLSDGTMRFLLLLAILANPAPHALIAIDEPETGLHPSMLRIVADFAREASLRSQVILTTHSPQLLDAFGSDPPTTTVARWSDGKTELNVVNGEELARWLKDYTLGALYRSGELESLP